MAKIPNSLGKIKCITLHKFAKCDTKYVWHRVIFSLVHFVVIAVPISERYLTLDIFFRVMIKVIMYKYH
jgi:hypothetical protein